MEAELQVMQQLIERGAAINHRDSDGLSCLAAAVFAGRRSAIALLCAAGADVDAAADVQGNSALQVAAFDPVKNNSSRYKFIQSFRRCQQKYFTLPKLVKKYQNYMDGCNYFFHENSIKS